MESRPSFLARLFQLAQTFEYHQPLTTIEECAERINQLDRPAEDVYGGSTLIASATRSLMDDHRTFFSLVRQKRGRWGWESLAELSGELTRDPLTDDIVARGTVRISQSTVRGIWLIAIIVAALIAVGALQTQFIVLILVLAAFSIYQAARGILGWIELRGLIRDIMSRPAVLPTKAKREAEAAAGDVLVDMTFNDPPIEADEDSSLRQSR